MDCAVVGGAFGACPKTATPPSTVASDTNKAHRCMGAKTLVWRDWLRRTDEFSIELVRTPGRAFDGPRRLPVDLTLFCAHPVRCPIWQGIYRRCLRPSTVQGC